ncbi:MAG: PHP domain-containing protein [Ruminococcus sp.]|jgi:putative hydrolase|nr:PHP domain-containing protein [Ruminococcus sp.]
MFKPYLPTDFVADTHTHTIASTHAYSTVTENARAAADAKLSYLGITNHSYMDPEDAPHLWHFHNLPRAIPRELFGVKMLFGVEASIITPEGGISFPEWECENLDWVIASVHFLIDGITDYTDAYLGVSQNKFVNVIGHCANRGAPFDYDKVLPAFRDGGKLVEINESYISQKDKYTLYMRLALKCKEHSVPVIVNSDAHFHTRIGQFDGAADIFNQIEMPRELVVNSSLENFEKYLNRYVTLK